MASLLLFSGYNSAKILCPTQSSKLLLSDRRNRLGDDVIEACKCLKAWQREGFLLSQELEDMEGMLQGLEEQGISLERAGGR